MMGYLEDRAEKENFLEIEHHLKECSDCRIFEDELNRNTVTPFGSLDPIQPPKELWGKVQSEIRELNQKRSLPQEGLIERIRTSISIRRLSYGIPALVAALLLLTVFPRTPVNVNVQTEQYIAEALGVTNGTGDFESLNFDTEVEFFFM